MKKDVVTKVTIYIDKEELWTLSSIGKEQTMSDKWDTFQKWIDKQYPFPEDFDCLEGICEGNVIATRGFLPLVNLPKFKC